MLNGLNSSPRSCTVVRALIFVFLNSETDMLEMYGSRTSFSRNDTERNAFGGFGSHAHPPSGLGLPRVLLSNHLSMLCSPLGSFTLSCRMMPLGMAVGLPEAIS